MPTFETIEYGGWSRAGRLSNDIIELVVTQEVGPRIMHFAFTGGANVFAQRKAFMGKTGGDEWVNYGGHRLWIAPEDRQLTYQPDNSPVELTMNGETLGALQPLEAIGLQKELLITLHRSDAHVRIVHRLHNRGPWPITVAPWALSVMTHGGTAILPLPPRGTHTENLLPTSSLTLWAYTDLSDPRWTFGREHILLRQDASTATPQKIGGMVPSGWLAYALPGQLFVKRFELVRRNGTYPDMNCSAEIFTNDWMLELETLGPLQTIVPGDSIEHVEEWSLHKLAQIPASEAELAEEVLPIIRAGA